MACKIYFTVFFGSLKPHARWVAVKVEVDRAGEQVDVGRLKRNVRAGGWQPEPSMGGSGWGRAPIAALQN